MIDIHCHILPAIDDGADTLEESVRFCRMAVADGIHSIVTTPHMRDDTYPNTPETIRPVFRKLVERVREEGIPIRLIPGAEVHLAPDLPARHRAGRLMTYAEQGKFLLLELPYQQYPVRVEEVIFQLRLLGITPVLAHPERTSFILDDPSRLGRLRELGAMTQFTGSSILGKFGQEVVEFCQEMVQRGWMDTIATDAHDLRYRPPKLSEAVNRLAEWIGPEKARRMVDAVPRGITEGRDPDSFREAAIRDEPRPRGWSWFRRRRAGRGD